MRHPTYGRLATYARRAGIPVRDPLYDAQQKERAWHSQPGDLVPNPIEGAGAVMHVEVRSSDNCISRVSHNVPPATQPLTIWRALTYAALAIAIGVLAAFPW